MPGLRATRPPSRRSGLERCQRSRLQHSTYAEQDVAAPHRPPRTRLVGPPTSPSPPPRFSLLSAAPPPHQTVQRIRGPRCHAVVSFFSLRRRGAESDPLSRRRQRPSRVDELFCERHEGELTMWLEADLSLTGKASLLRPPVWEAKLLEVDLSLSLSLSLSPTEYQCMEQSVCSR